MALSHRRRIVAATAGTLLAAGLAVGVPAPARAAVSLGLYGNFATIGVTATLSGVDLDPAALTATVLYRPRGAADYREGFAPTHLAGTNRYVGSLFWLTPGTEYDVRVRLKGPNGFAQVAEGQVSTRAEVGAPVATARALYARGRGTDRAPCTEADPCALSKALRLANAGTTVLLRGTDGPYEVGGLTMSQSGEPGAPIVITSYPDERAVLDGGYTREFAWTATATTGVFRTVIDPEPGRVELVSVNGRRLYPHPSRAHLEVPGNAIAPGGYVTVPESGGTALYVRLAGNANPSGTAFTVSRFNSALTVSGSHVQIANLTFRNYGVLDIDNDRTGRAIYLDGAADTVIHRNSFVHNTVGVALKRAVSRNVIQHNAFTDSTAGWPWQAAKDSGLESPGVGFVGPSTGQGNVIRHNTFTDYFDALAVCPSQNGELTNETDVHDNTVTRAGDDGLAADGTCSNVRIWGNRFNQVHTGLSFAPVFEGPIYAIRNVITDIRPAIGQGWKGRPVKLNSGKVGGVAPVSGPMYLFHNTADAVQPGTAGFEIWAADATWRLLYARNNVWVGTRYGYTKQDVVDPADSHRLDLNYDALWAPGTPYARWDRVGSPTPPDYPTLTDFRAGTGLELHGVNAAPGFVGGGDYRLTAGSALIDRGRWIAGINDGYRGCPEPGAFETGSNGQLAIARPLTVSPTNPTVGTDITVEYAVRNVGTSPVCVRYLMVAVRGPGGIRPDITVDQPLIIQPGASETFRATSRLSAAGTYTAWPAYYDTTAWNRLDGDSTFTVGG
jgi:parallel beta-helix repeat protein